MKLKEILSAARKLTPLEIAAMLLPVLVFCIPFERRHVFPTEFSYMFGSFNEYVTNYLYVTDVLTFVVVALSVFGILQLWRSIPVERHGVILAVLFFLLVLAPTVSPVDLDLSLPFYARLALFGLFAIITSFLLRARGIEHLTLFAIMAAGLFQSLIGIIQFTLQRSLGLHIFGESPLSPQISGVAKIVMDGSRYIRAYGTFPHPNVFAAFLAITLPATLIIIYRRKERILCELQYFVPYLLALLIQILALVLTFSRTGIAAAAFTVLCVGLYMYLIIKHERMDSTHKRQIFTFMIVLAIALFSIGLAVLPFAKTRIRIADQNGDAAVSERVRLLNVSRETFLSHKVLGAGMHTFVVNMPKDGLYAWQFQPTHNIYWLILAENGIIGVLAFIGLILFVLVNGIRQILSAVSPNKILLVFGFVGILSYLLIGLFDHHPWDMQQSQLTWWLLVGLVVSHL